jgi:hypothetical protein
MPSVSQSDRLAGTLTVIKTLARNAFSAAQTQTVWTPATGKQIMLRYMRVTCSGATVITVKIGTTLIWEGDFTTTWSQDAFYPPDDCVATDNTANDALTITSSAAVTVGCTAMGWEQ